MRQFGLALFKPSFRDLLAFERLGFRVNDFAASRNENSRGVSKAAIALFLDGIVPMAGSNLPQEVSVAIFVAIVPKNKLK